jgi:putative sterol carrier protein
VHWHIKDGDTVDSFQTVLHEGTCTVTAGTGEEPRTALTMPGTEFLKIVTNNANPVTLFMTRKLKVSGDVGFATALPNMFHIPSA